MAYWRGGGIVPGAGYWKRGDEEARVGHSSLKGEVRGFVEERAEEEEEGLLAAEEGGGRRTLQVKSDGSVRFCRKVRPFHSTLSREATADSYEVPGTRSAMSGNRTARTTARPAAAAFSRWTTTARGSAEAASCVSSLPPRSRPCSHSRLAGLGKLQVLPPRAVVHRHPGYLLLRRSLPRTSRLRRRIRRCAPFLPSLSSSSS